MTIVELAKEKGEKWKRKNDRDKWSHVWLNNAENERIQKHFERTTDRKISVYIRKFILGKPHIGSNP